MDIIRNFEELRKENIPLAGGKGANLGELTSIKIPVPSGFVVVTPAYDSFVKENNLEKIITENILDKNNDGSIIRSAFIKSPIQKDIKNAILEAYKKLGKGPVAVRSSATAEDLPSASFAGQQDTYLNIIGETELLDAILRVWASLWTKRAILYRNHQNIDPKKVKLAVVVQKMLDADFAGVMFTANPVNGNRKEMVVDANPGLGEAVVSGLVIPDHFVMRRKWCKWRIVKSMAGKYDFIIMPKEGGGTKQVEKQSGYIQLPQKALIELVKLGAEIQKHFNTPQDIEWVWSKGKISIVQSRPITALPDELSKQGKINRLIAGTLAEMMPTRPLPLEATLFGPTLVVNKLLRPFLKLLGLRISSTNRFLIEKDGILVHYNGKIKPRPTLAIIFAPFLLGAYSVKYNSSKWKNDARIIRIIEKIKEFEKKDYEKLSPESLIEVIKEALGIFPVIFKVRILYLPRVVFSIATLSLILLLIGQKRNLSTFLFSGITTKVTKTNDILNNLALKISQEDLLREIFLNNEPQDINSQLKNIKIGRDFLLEFQTFLDAYGYRESGGTMLISQPTWKESPEVVFGILKTLADTPLHKKPKKKWEDTRDELLGQSVFRFPPFRSFFLKLLNTARHFQEIREDSRFYLMMTVPTLRSAIFELGNRLIKVKVLSKSKDVFYLQFNELIEIVKSLQYKDNQTNKWNSLISQRKLKYTELKNIPVVDPRLYRNTKNKEGALLVGMPGSSGVTEGFARIIHQSSEFNKLKHDDILIAPYTNPSWTPLFEIASAVVVDTGGVMSHAAIVAREYGIPAVMGVVDGTVKLKDGDKIRVDGTSGSVFKI